VIKVKISLHKIFLPLKAEKKHYTRDQIFCNRK
jgi:hypothetical protein